LLITDGVFFVDGDIAPLPRAVAISRKKFNCIMMVDDATLRGVLGRNGRGTVDQLGPCNVTTSAATLSKASPDLDVTCRTAQVIDRAAAVAPEHGPKMGVIDHMMQLNFSARSHSAGSGAISPSIENTASVISIYGRPVSVSLQRRRNPTTLCLENLDGRFESRQPSMMEGDSISSERIRSSLPGNGRTVPAFAVKPDWRQRLPRPLEFPNLFLRAPCAGPSCRAIVRNRPGSDAVRADRVDRRAPKCLMRRQAEIVVRAQIDDVLAVEMRDRPLLALSTRKRKCRPLASIPAKLFVQISERILSCGCH